MGLIYLEVNSKTVEVSKDYKKGDLLFWPGNDLGQIFKTLLIQNVCIGSVLYCTFMFAFIETAVKTVSV